MSIDSQSIAIFQPYMYGHQKRLVDPAFIPMDHTKNPYPKLREYYLLRKIFLQLDDISEKYIGLFALNFKRKACLNGAEVIQHILNHPGYDVYLFNPFPQHDLQYYDMWDRGDHQHPHVTSVAQKILDMTHTQIDLSQLARPHTKTLYSNFWVGTKRFWEGYMTFLIPIAEKMIECDMPYFKDTTYYRGPTPFFPFIVERFFTTFLLRHSEYNMMDYVYPAHMHDTLMFSEYEREVCKRIAPLSRVMDAQYGDIWPNSAKQLLIETRNSYRSELIQLGYSEKIRFLD